MYTRTKQEIDWAIQRWRKHDYMFGELDEWVTPFLNVPPKTGWLSVVRRASFKSQPQVARLLNCSKDTVHRAEVSERDGTITLETLSWYADALDCELVYAIRPKEKRLYSDRILEKILPLALKDRVPQFYYQRVNALADRILELMYDPWFRKANGWCRNPANEGRGIALILKRTRATRPATDPPKF